MAHFPFDIGCWSTSNSVFARATFRFADAEEHQAENILGRVSKSKKAAPTMASVANETVAVRNWI
ncbi:hypothetical protein AOQ73_19465 [Bradyrhizobium pachyrhizi]|uniref:hypothetical protein n=1 Tax=Bradyrhizobium pachyrhizi TaxID=280333 RepID=UPI0007054C0C|nr:hypothetical protein [Bradyrhizobium pachyrhizi]KRP99756.1 hypothetical protein AOQ73_19465 [Bradyrhizobium pachyrhizi]